MECAAAHHPPDDCLRRVSTHLDLPEVAAGREPQNNNFRFFSFDQALGRRNFEMEGSRSTAVTQVSSSRLIQGAIR